MSIGHFEERTGPGPHMSKVVVHGDTIYLAGQVADDTSVGVKEQTEQILATIDRQLAEQGSDKSKVLWTQIWLQDIESDFSQMNEAWNAWVADGNMPVRACTQAKLALPQFAVEIMVIVAK